MEIQKLLIENQANLILSQVEKSLLEKCHKEIKIQAGKKSILGMGVGRWSCYSLISDFDNTDVEIFGSLNRVSSTYASKARSEAVKGGDGSKGTIHLNYSDVNPFTAGTNGWEQFLGRANLSYYSLGNKVLFLMNDSKSETSFLYRMVPIWERSTLAQNGTTRQTYIWTGSMHEVKQKNHIRTNHINRINQIRQEYKASEHLRIPSIKW